MSWIDALKAASDWKGNPPADQFRVTEFRERMRLPLPKSFIEFLACFNGGEGSLAPDLNKVYLMPIEEILEAQEFWDVEGSLPGHILFGTDYGGFGFLFDTTRESQSGEFPVMMCPVSSLSTGDLEPFCETFPELFTRPLF